MTRRLWMIVSLLAAAAATWIYLGFGPDALLWAWSRIMAPAAALPPAVPATRLADAVLVGLAVAYLTGFVPLTIGTWLQGAHLTSVARAAAAASAAGADEVATARLAILRTEAERQSPWQLLLQFDLVGVDSPPGAVPQGRAGIERAAIVGDLVAHQSAASLFRGLAWICLCLGMFALVSQTISNLLGTDLLQRPSKGLELAATRGLLSAVTAIVTAALIDLGARLAAAAIRHRAEMLGRRLERLGRSRRELGDWDREPVLTAEPISPTSIQQPSGRDDSIERTAALIERSQQQISHRVDEALQSVTGKTIRPLLQEVSGTLAVLAGQMGRMVERLDSKLAEQQDESHRIAESVAAAREEIARQTAVMVERSQRQMAESVDAAMQRLAEETVRPMLQEVCGQLAVLGERAGTAADALDRRLAQQHDDTRRIAEFAASARDEIARQTTTLLEQQQQQIAARVEGALETLTGATVRPMLQEVSRLLEVLSGQAGALVQTLDRGLAEQREDGRRLAEAVTAGNGRVAELLGELHQAMDRSTATVEQRLDRMVAAQESSASALHEARTAGPTAPIAHGAPADRDLLAMLSRFLSDTGGDGATRHSLPVTGSQRSAESWSDRLAELRRSSAELTRGLPVLRPDGPK